MKRCQVCGAMSDVAASSCASCGEGSWIVVDAPAAAPKKAKKQKATKPVDEPVDEPVVVPVIEDDPVISDAEFAAELVTASDEDLIALQLDSRMSDAWLALVTAELAKRSGA